MASPVNPPRGMRDFLPVDKARRERVLAVIRSVFSAHGFDEIETPVMEDSSRLHAGLGGDNEKLAYGVLKRGLTAEDFATATDALDLTDLGLRFDLTVPLTRFYATHRAELPKVFRSIQIGSVWRAERPQQGRYRQFIQCDIDVVGEPSTLAELELITATLSTLEALGLIGCTIRINDRRILSGLLDSIFLPRDQHEAALITIDKLDKLGPNGVIAELRDRKFDEVAVTLLDVYLAGHIGEGMVNFSAEQLSTYLPVEVDRFVIDEIVALADGIEAAGFASSRLKFDPFLVRGMGYYTGTIFEIEHPDLPYSLGGGGRYDGMIGRFLGADVPAAGFSIGFERIVDLVRLRDDESAGGVALVYDSDVTSATLMRLKAELIASGRRVRLERAPRNLKPLLAQLTASGFTEIATVSIGAATVADLRMRKLAAG
ncbi:histidine--tRNA ligase [Glaciihabitans sp. GrIS 2.15]|uniref:histidine--tRNA ligase n=1 Tax=Glaciihabitans sp. GrIS 2.15 TaxID=3071710 RepID=UPI002E0093B8|nr:histidyl-tRNA synthetase [Glaciihabitans sp. GrIS 2.15]